VLGWGDVKSLRGRRRAANREGAGERKKEKLPRRIQRREKEIEFFESKLGIGLMAAGRVKYVSLSWFNRL